MHICTRRPRPPISPARMRVGSEALVGTEGGAGGAGGPSKSEWNEQKQNNHFVMDNVQGSLDHLVPLSRFLPCNVSTVDGGCVRLAFH